MLDAADLLGVFAEAILRSANSSSQKSRFSNYIGSDLDGAIGFIDEPTPNGLIKHVGLTSGRVLDFGCGLGPHRSLLEQSGLHWTGLDYNGTIDPTALKRGADLENEIVKYDGGSFPFQDSTFEAVWSFQSLEHVKSAEETFKEIARVLKPHGTLFGSTSFLEAYHARSTYNYTPYGFKLLCDRNDLALTKIVPVTDGLSLVFRHFFMSLGMAEQEYDDWNKMMKSGGVFFDVLRQRARTTENEHNLAEAMAQMCGHFYFIAKRVE